MTTAQLKMMKEVTKEIMRRSATDKAFRSLCLSDAEQAVVAVTGSKLPSGMKLRFVEENAAGDCLVLPPMVTSMAIEDEVFDRAVGEPPTCCGTCRECFRS